MGELERMARDVFELTYDLVVLEDNVEDIKRKVIVKYLKAWSQENKLQHGNVSNRDSTRIRLGSMDHGSGFVVDLFPGRPKLQAGCFFWLKFGSPAVMQKEFFFLYRTYLFSCNSCVLAARPARRTDASAPLSAGAASPPPPFGMGRGESAAPEFTS